VEIVKNISGVFIACCYICACITYSYLTRKKKVAPKLATWIIFSTATGINFATYIGKNIGQLDWRIASLQASDFISCIGIATSLLVFQYKIKFTIFDLWCLGFSGFTLLLWWISRDPEISNFFIQALICIGYFPTVSDIFKNKKHSESYLLWGSYFVASVASLAFVLFFEGDIISIVYAIRSTCMLFGMILLMMIFGRRIS
jgi:hypothetical protein